jgi:hypothetical protein
MLPHLPHATESNAMLWHSVMLLAKGLLGSCDVQAQLSGVAAILLQVHWLFLHLVLLLYAAPHLPGEVDTPWQQQ